MRKHTPAPWRIEAWQLVADGAVLGDLYSWSDDTLVNRAEAEANARLIAAAPDLLEALQKLLPEMRGLAMVSPLMQAYVETCEAAIAKATGEQA